MSLTKIIQPFSQSDFFGNYWEKEVLHISRKDPSYFSFLLDDFSIEDIIWKTCIKWGDVSLARSNTNYLNSPHGIGSPTLLKIKDAIQDGYTLVVNRMEKKSLCLAKFCRDVEKELYFNSNLNLYITNANCQGLDYHYDDEDVFILQLEGKKIWKIYEDNIPLPLADLPYQTVDCGSSSFNNYILHPGDVLYIPRGFIHEAHACEERSIHLTLSVSVLRWNNFLQSFLRVIAQNDINFRKSIPIEIFKAGNVDIAEPIFQLLIQNKNNFQAIKTTFSNMQEQLLNSKERLPSNLSLYDPDFNLESNSKVKICDDQVFIIDRTEMGLTLRFIGASIDFHYDLENTVEYLCQKKVFRVVDLPGNINIDEKIVFVKKLIYCGFLSKIS